MTAHSPRRLHVAAPSTIRPGQPAEIVIAALDGLGNPAVLETAAVVFEGLPDGVGVEPVEVGGERGPHARVRVENLPPGIHRLKVRGEGGALEGLEAESNPIVVRSGVRRVLWGDLHGHSQISDGTGTPDQYYAYARDVAGLDVSALTDHDHWGMRPLDSDSETWEAIRESVIRHHAPERFVTLLGYEWTNWLHGHRHVLYFHDPGEADASEDPRAQVYSSLDPRYETPAQLWEALRGQPALTFAHHSAGGPVSTNWRGFPPDPVLEPVTEIVSGHGSSEAPDSPKPIYDPVPGNYVRDVIDAGYVLGFVGSGDSHDGHPGLVQLADPNDSGGIAAIHSESLTRSGVLDALRRRDVYATNGERIWLDVSLDGHPMGSVLEHEAGDPPETQKLVVEVAGTGPIERIDLIRTGHKASIPGNGQLDLRFEREIPRLMPGEYHYVRVVQSDDKAAWSSPIFSR